MTSLTDNLAVSLYFTDEYEDVIQTDTAPVNWETRDVTKIENWLKPKQQKKLPDYENETNWDNDNNYPRGSEFSEPADFTSADDIIDDPIIDMITDDVDQESHDRLVLLAKKYASEIVRFTNEDKARLEMINQKMDLKFPRYSVEDWKLLDEAKVLVHELTNISGGES